MKKWIIGSLIGAIIVFAWQFLSWMMMDLHSAEHKYTPAQDQILSTLNAANLEEGMYVMPNVPSTASQDDHQKLWKENNGKPWAMVTYGKTAKADMATPMIMGFVI